MFDVVIRRRLALARIFTGAVLAVHHAGILPYAAATYGRGGVLPSHLDNPVPLAASPLAVLDAPWIVTALVATLLVAALSYAAGLFTRASGLVLWGGAMVLFHRNQLTLNPSLAYLGLWFLAQAFLPENPSWSIDRWLARRRGVSFDDGPDRLPTDVAWVVWIVACVGYSFSGVTKLMSPSWVRGEAVSLILSSPLGRGGAMGHAMLALPSAVLVAMTWGVMLLELAAAPLLLSRRLRPWSWGALLAMHGGLVLLLDIADISLPMIAFHLLTFDTAALDGRRTRPEAPRAAGEGLRAPA